MYGIQVKNNTGNLMIDSTYANLAHLLTQTQSMGGGGEFTVSVSSQQMPIIALDAPGGAGVVESGQSGSTWMWRVKANSAGAVTAFVYGAAPPPPPAWGIRVHNEAGVPVFNSSPGYLRIVAVLPCAYSPGNFPVASISLPSSRYAVSVGTPRGELSGASINTDAVYTTSTSAAVHHNLNKSFSGPWSRHTGIMFGAGVTTALVLDVSGL